MAKSEATSRRLLVTVICKLRSSLRSSRPSFLVRSHLHYLRRLFGGGIVYDNVLARRLERVVATEGEYGHAVEEGYVVDELIVECSEPFKL